MKTKKAHLIAPDARTLEAVVITKSDGAPKETTQPMEPPPNVLGGDPKNQQGHHQSLPKAKKKAALSWARFSDWSPEMESRKTRATELAWKNVPLAFEIFGDRTPEQEQAVVESWVAELVKSDTSMYMAEHHEGMHIPDIVAFGTERIDELELSIDTTTKADPVADVATRVFARYREDAERVAMLKGPAELKRIIEAFGAYSATARSNRLPHEARLVQLDLGLEATVELTECLTRNERGFDWMCFNDHLRGNKAIDERLLRPQVDLEADFDRATAKGVMHTQADLAAMGYDLGDLELLSEHQLEIFTVAASRAEEDSRAATPKLLERVKALGFSKKDLDAARRYLADDAPMAIGFAPQQRLHASETTVVEALNADGTYRTAFETGITAERGMLEWRDRMTSLEHLSHQREQRMFGPTVNFAPHEHPKYSAYAGSTMLSHYGAARLTLDPKLKKRATLSFPNSSYVGTTRSFDHVLLEAPDGVLEQILKLVPPTDGQPNPLSGLFEYEIFGAVELARDCSGVDVESFIRTDDLERQMEALAQRHELQLRWV